MRAIDGDELLGIERLLDTDVVRQSKTASWLLDQVLHDIQAMPTLTTPSEWVSVEERLPEVGQEVLVYWWNTSQKAEHFELTHYDGDHWFLLDNTERPWIVVVAWMPLPAPPDRRPPEGEEKTR